MLVLGSFSFSFQLGLSRRDAMLVAFCLSWDLNKNSFLKISKKMFLAGKETIQILVFQIICEFQTATNIAPFI